MLYKATFKPSQLLDVLANTWVAKDEAISSRLDNGARYGFASAATCIEDAALRLGHQNASGQASTSQQAAVKLELSPQQSSLQDDSDDEEEEPPVPFPTPSPPGFLDPRTLDPQALGMTLVLDGKAQSMGVSPLMVS